MPLLFPSLLQHIEVFHEFSTTALKDFWGIASNLDFHSM